MPSKYALYRQISKEIGTRYDHALALVLELPGAAEYIEADRHLREGSKGLLRDRLTEVFRAAGGGPEQRHQAEAAIAHADAKAWELAQHWERWAELQVQKWNGVLLDDDDLMQEALIGLLKAARRWDPDVATFTTFSRWWIRAQMSRQTDNVGRPVRLPGGVVDLLNQLNKAQRLFGETVDESNIERFAEELGITVERMRKVLGYRTLLYPKNLDAPLDDDGDTRLSDVLGDDEAIEADEDLHERRAIADLEEHIDALEAVKPKCARIICLRFGLRGLPALTLQQIRPEFGVSRERIRQLEVEGLTWLRHRMNTFTASTTPGGSASHIAQESDMALSPLPAITIKSDEERAADPSRCKITGCDCKKKNRGICPKHLKRLKKAGIYEQYADPSKWRSEPEVVDKESPVELRDRLKAHEQLSSIEIAFLDNYIVISNATQQQLELAQRMAGEAWAGFTFVNSTGSVPPDAAPVAALLEDLDTPSASEPPPTEVDAPSVPLAPAFSFETGGLVLPADKVAEIADRAAEQHGKPAVFTYKHKLDTTARHLIDQVPRTRAAAIAEEDEWRAGIGLTLTDLTEARACARQVVAASEVLEDCGPDGPVLVLTSVGGEDIDLPRWMQDRLTELVAPGVKQFIAELTDLVRGNRSAS